MGNPENEGKIEQLMEVIDKVQKLDIYSCLELFSLIAFQILPG